MSFNTQSRAVDQGSGRVFDAADPDRHGKIINAGPQQSEVHFDDDISQIVPNAHLRTAETPKVDLDNPVLPTEPPVHFAVRRGQEAWQRLRSYSTWHDWKQVGAALVIGRAEAMRDGHVNKPRGRSYNAAINAFLKKFGFDDLDSGDRSRLLDVMDHQTEVEAWLGDQKPKERLRLNHPSSIWRKWKASTAVPDPTAASKPSRMQELKDERDRYKREIERGGGDLWTPEDTPQNIAKIMLGKLTTSKAEKVAREILKALKAEKQS